LSNRQTFNMNGIADLFNKSLPTVAAWVKRGCPHSRETSKQYVFDAAAVADWRVQDALTEETGGELVLTAERARLVYHQANKTALEEETLKGELIPANLVKDTWASLVISFRAKMLGLPNKAAPQLIGVDDLKEIEKLLQDFIYDALSELSDADAQSDSYGSSADGETTAEAYRESVG